jgi:hypothetical protein
VESIEAFPASSHLSATGATGFWKFGPTMQPPVSKVNPRMTLLRFQKRESNASNFGVISPLLQIPMFMASRSLVRIGSSS